MKRLQVCVSMVFLLLTACDTTSPAPTEVPIVAPPSSSAAAPTPLQTVGAAATTSTPLLTSTTLCLVLNPAATPPWPSSPLPLPRLPANTALLLLNGHRSVPEDGRLPCLMALDAPGTPRWSAISNPRYDWRWDQRARILSVQTTDPDDRSTRLFWNRSFDHDGTERLDFATGRVVHGTVFSPDGRQLVYLEWRDQPGFAAAWQLILMDIPTKQERVLLEGFSTFVTPQAPPVDHDLPKAPFAWSASTDRIYLYELPLGDAPPQGVWSLKPDGSELQRLVSNEMVSLPVLSPDERRLAYLVFDPNFAPVLKPEAQGIWSPANQLRVVDVRSGFDRVVLAERQGGLYENRAIWSPDSQSVLLEHSRNASGLGAIYGADDDLLAVHADGSSVQALRVLDHPHEERVGDILGCNNGEVVYVLNRDQHVNSVIASNLEGKSRTVTTLAGSDRYSIALVGCFQ